MTSPERTYRWKPLNEFSDDARQLLFKFNDDEVRGQECPQTSNEQPDRAGSYQTDEVAQTSAQEREVRSTATPLERAYK